MTQPKSATQSGAAAQHSSFPVRRGPARIVCAMLWMLAAALVSACTSNPITFEPPPHEDERPVQWRSIARLEAEYPKPGRRFSDETVAAIEAFLVDHARVTPAALLAMQDVVLTGTSGTSRFGVQRFRLAAGESDSATGASSRVRHQLTLDIAGPDVLGTIAMTLDHRFRLWTYESKLRPQRNLPVPTLVTSIARFEPPEEGGKGYRMAGEAGETVVEAVEPLIPEELLPLMSLLCPPTALSGDFKIVSVPYRGVYNADLAIRPSLDNGGTTLVQVGSKSPLGRDLSIVVEHSSPQRIRWATESGGLRLEVGSAADLEAATATAAVIRRERGGMLMFDGVHVFSAYSADGKRLPAPKPDEIDPGKDSWLNFDASPLDLTIESLGRSSTELLRMVDYAHLESGLGRRGLLRSGEIQFALDLDVMPTGKDIEWAAAAQVYALQASGMTFQVRRTSMNIHGVPACRVDVLEEVIQRRRGQPQSIGTVFHSHLLMADGQSLLRVQITAGPGWDKHASSLDKLYQSIRFRSPLKLDATLAK